jgi:arylsulfatase A-like enzyme
VSTGLTRRELLGAGLAGALGLACERLRGDASRRPNLLLLVTDDQRADSLGFAGNPVVQTPRLDAWAADSTVFENAFVTTSVCAPSRASMLTGQWARRHGIADFHTSLALDRLARTPPVLLRGAGYRTGFLGKWGIGRALPRGAFDVFEGFRDRTDYWEQPGGRRVHLTQLLAEGAVDFLTRQRGDAPFFLQVSFKAPHGPWDQHPPDLVELYRDREIPLAPTATPEAAAALPDFLKRSLGGPFGAAWVADPEALRGHIRNYYRLVTGVDRAFGEIQDALSRLGLSQHTVVMYTSDNGFLFGEHGLSGKWLMFEESIRVPLVVHDPRLPAGERRRRVQEMALNVDLAPTLLDLAGLPPVEDMQGASLAPLLRGEATAWRDDWFYEQHLPVGERYLPWLEGIRTRDWKYAHYLDADSRSESLFDLRSDPLEQRDLAASPEHRPQLDALRRRWAEAAAALGPPEA